MIYIERGRERESHREREEREKETHTYTDRQTVREIHIDRVRNTETERVRDISHIYRQTDIQTKRAIQTLSETDRQKERERRGL